LDPQGVRPFSEAPPARQRPHVIVLGNEKGGSGKSTTAMHLIVALLRGGGSVGSIDLDARQGTLTRYVENRQASAAELPLPLPRHAAIRASQLDSAVAAAAEVLASGTHPDAYPPFARRVGDSVDPARKERKRNAANDRRTTGAASTRRPRRT